MPPADSLAFGQAGGDGVLLYNLWILGKFLQYYVTIGI